MTMTGSARKCDIGSQRLDVKSKQSKAQFSQSWFCRGAVGSLRSGASSPEMDKVEKLVRACLMTSNENKEYGV